MTQMRLVTTEPQGGDGSEATCHDEAQRRRKHLGSCTQTAVECQWLVDRAAGMTRTWTEHLAWRDDTELSKLMRQRENTGRPLGDADFVKEIGQQLSRDLMPKKPGPKRPKKKKKKPKTRKT